MSTQIFDVGHTYIANLDRNVGLTDFAMALVCAWGIKVSSVELKDVDLDESMVRAMAKQAEAERDRRAKVIHAEGEHQAAEKLSQAAERLASEPTAIQLRYLQTVSDITNQRSSTVIFPVPVDLMQMVQKMVKNVNTKESK